MKLRTEQIYVTRENGEKVLGFDLVGYHCNNIFSMFHIYPFIHHVTDGDIYSTRLLQYPVYYKTHPCRDEEEFNEVFDNIIKNFTCRINSLDLIELYRGDKHSVEMYNFISDSHPMFQCCIQSDIYTEREIFIYLGDDKFFKDTCTLIRRTYEEGKDNDTYMHHKKMLKYDDVKLIKVEDIETVLSII